MKSTLSRILIGLLIFIALIYYNQVTFRKQQSSGISYPSTIKILDSQVSLDGMRNGMFVWSIDATSDQFATETHIFWGPTSTPSALTKSDSPEAVGYPNKTTDYTEGKYFLPSKFDSKITYPSPGKYWFRAYAKINGEHLWSQEYQVIVPN